MRFSVLIFVLLASLPQQRLADHVVAVVNGEPIMLSELRQSLPSKEEGGDWSEEQMADRRRVLINQTLVLQEVRRLKIFTIEPAEVEEEVAREARLFPSDKEFEEALRARGMSLQCLRELLQRNLVVKKFYEYRFRRVSEISEINLREFHEGEWAKEFHRMFPDRVLPPFETVRDDVEKAYKVWKITEDLDIWLIRARNNSLIVYN